MNETTKQTLARVGAWVGGIVGATLTLFVALPAMGVGDYLVANTAAWLGLVGIQAIAWTLAVLGVLAGVAFTWWALFSYDAGRLRDGPYVIWFV